MLKKAFSLIELSIAIMVISILIVGFLNVSSGKSSNNKVKITKDRIDVIYKSLGEFVLKNKRLPCPASIKAIKTSDATYGTEGIAAGTCTAGTGVYLSTATNATKMVYGMVPTQTLGLSSDYGEDNFGNKIAYIVDKDYTSSTTFASANTGIIGQKYVNGALTTDVGNAIYALVSYGANQSGAFSAKTSNQNAASSDVDERYNYPTSFNDTAKTANFSQILVKSTERSTVFDDIVYYRNRDDFLKDNNAGNVVNGNVTSEANITIVPGCNATGGVLPDKTTVSGTTIFKFNTAGAYTLTCPVAINNVSVLVVGGGGGGSSDIGGGGGGGEVVSTTMNISTSSTIKVGAGGVRGNGPSGSTISGQTGGTSSIESSGATTVRALGGSGARGRGVDAHNGSTGTGYTGGGAAYASSSTGSIGTGGASYKGGDSNTSGGGGGGGAGGAGQSRAAGAAGGVGLSSSITGTPTTYGGGGGGSGYNAIAGVGGSGGGGAGTDIYPNSPDGVSGVNGLGGGGGGAGSNGSINAGGGTGGSGVVIIRYVN